VERADTATAARIRTRIPTQAFTGRCRSIRINAFAPACPPLPLFRRTAMPRTSAPADAPSLREQLIRESCSMVRHLVTNGVRVPAQLVNATDQMETAAAQGRDVDVVTLAATHERLSRLVAPAKPGTLYLLDYGFHERGVSTTLGPVKVVRDLVRVAIGCVIVFIVLSVIQMVDADRLVDLFGRQFVVLEIILERIFWLAAAGIGASFAMLFQLNDQIVARTYDPDEAPSVWIKFFLGLVAGFILVALVPLDNGPESQATVLVPPTVALLGGFSASAVYRILTRMVEALESIFSGGAQAQVAAAERAAVMRATDETAQARVALAGKMVELQQQVAAGAPAHQVAEHLREMTASLMPGSLEPMPVIAVPLQPNAAAAADAAPDRVPALALVSAPQDAGAQEDGSAAADGAAQPEAGATASG
jgi:hypothetical protein